MKHYCHITLLFFLLLCCCNTVTAKQNKKISRAKAPIPVIFDTDMGNDVDDVMALDLLYKSMESGKIKLLAVMCNKEGDASLQFLDIMNTWYGHPSIPIGQVVKGADCSNDGVNSATGLSYVQAVVNMTNNGKSMFARSIADVTQLPEAYKLYRKMLVKAKDHSVVIISTGFSTNLARLIESKADEYSPLNGTQLIAKKVKYISIMGGAYKANSDKEYNIVRDVKSAAMLFEKSPVPIVASPFEVGTSVCYPSSSIEKDFTWATYHPLIEAYKSYLAMPYDRPMWDPTAVLYVIEPNGAFFGKSVKGDVKVTDDGYTRFTPDTKGKVCYLSVTPQQAQRIKEYFVKTITAKPAHYATAVK